MELPKKVQIFFKFPELKSPEWSRPEQMGTRKIRMYM